MSEPPGARSVVRAWLASPVLPAAVIVLLGVWKLAGLGAHLDLPENDQTAYLAWAREGRLHAKAPLYVGYLQALSRVSGLGPAGVFALERALTPALFAGAAYLALRGLVSPLVAAIVALHALNLRLVLQETNAAHLVAVVFHLLAIAALALAGRRGVPSALGLLGLGGLVRRDAWIVLALAAPVLVWWAVTGPRVSLRRRLLAWAPAAAAAAVAGWFLAHRSGEAQPLVSVLRVGLIANVIESLSDFTPHVGSFDLWRDAQAFAPELYRPDASVLGILRRYPQVVAMHVAANLVALPRTIAALTLRHATWSHFALFWAAAAILVVAAGRAARADPDLPGDHRRSAAAYLALLSGVPILTGLVLLKHEARFTLVVLPLLLLLVAAAVQGALLAWRRVTGRPSASPRRELAALWALLLAYGLLPVGPLTGLPRSPGRVRETVAFVAPHVSGGVVASDMAGVICTFATRCRPVLLRRDTLLDPDAWARAGADRVFLSERALRQRPGTRDPLAQLRAEPRWRVLAEHRLGVVLGPRAP